MNGLRSLCCCIGVLLLVGGCVIGEVDTPFERLVAFPFMGDICLSTPNDDNSWLLRLIDERTQKPLANIEIFRLDPIPDPDSFLSWIRYGDEENIRTKVTQTGDAGYTRILNCHVTKLEAQLETSVLQLDFDQKQAKLIPLHLSKDETQILKFHEDDPGHFTIEIPSSTQSK